MTKNNNEKMVEISNGRVSSIDIRPSTFFDGRGVNVWIHYYVLFYALLYKESITTNKCDIVALLLCNTRVRDYY